jgi:glycerol uptake facilitator-like aquaporin
MVNVARRVVGEGLGVLTFTFLAGSAIVINDVTNGGLGLLGMAVTTGLAYSLVVFVLYPVSGGHINPAVTVGQVAARRIPPSIAALYIGAQAAGAVIGALLLELIYRGFVSDVARTASLSFDPRMQGLTGGFLEAILTFVLVTAYFRGFLDRRGNPSLGAIAMGLVVMFSFLMAFPVTGAALNVARVFGTDVLARHWTDFWWYWLGLAGGAVAGLGYEFLFASHEEEPAIH